MANPPRITTPKQPRSQKTFERLVAAAREILEEEGPEGVTVQAVVARARSSVGSFYARFKGKDDLLAYLAEHVRESALAEWRASTERQRVGSALLAEAIARAVDQLRQVRQRWDAGVKAAAGLTDESASHDEFRRGVIDDLAHRLLQHRSEIRHANPELAARIGLSAVLGVMDHRALTRNDLDLDDEELRQECVGLLLAYFTGRASESTEQVEFFDVWS